MQPEAWRQIERIYEAARVLEPERRKEFLGHVCAGDEALRQEVESLLVYDRDTTEFIESPALEVMAQDLAAEAPRMAGQTLGPYQLTTLLEKGGMGEVYRARDSRLGREVAVKVLPEGFGESVHKRFEQEARAASRLNHPNIVSIYDVGRERGVFYIVSELVEGQSLRTLIGSLPLEKALDCAAQVAEGLAAAHDAGIVHRDVKPENVMVTRDGRAKILDFGLAKERGPVARGASTATGMAVGTAGYMSPEQVRGSDTDLRSDVFSFGVMLYEMLAGRRPFDRGSPVETMSATLDTQPPDLPASVPAELRELVFRCLEKQPDRRFPSMRQLIPALSGIGSGREGRRWGLRRARKWLGATALAAAMIGAVGLLVTAMRTPVPEPSNPLPVTSYPGSEILPALSPDGKLVAFCWEGEKLENVDIYIKEIGAEIPYRLTTDPLPDISPAWSPDGLRIAFRRVLKDANSQIVVKSYLGGPEKVLAEWAYTTSADGRPPSRDVCWSRDGQWLVATGRKTRSEPFGLYAISVETGETHRILEPVAGYDGDTEPALSPDGRTLAFIRATGPWRGDIYLLPVSDRLVPREAPRRLTFQNQLVFNPAWMPGGKSVVFSNVNADFTVGLSKVKIPTSPRGAVPRPERDRLAGQQAHDPTISSAGRLVYTRGDSDVNIWALDLPGVSRGKGVPLPLISSSRIEIQPDFSADGKRIAFISDRSGKFAIWVCQRDGSNPVQINSEEGLASSPRWSPDGRQILYTATHRYPEIYVVGAGGGIARRLVKAPPAADSPNWSRDGKSIYFASPRRGVWQLWRKPAAGGEPVQVTKGGGLAAQESWDGKYVYYTKAKGYFSSLWKVPVGGGAETQVIPSIAYAHNFAVTKNGIYFMPLGGILPRTDLMFFQFDTGRVRNILRIQKKVYLGLAVAPDTETLLYTQLDHQNKDLWMVERFR